jgi:multiple sugar transport system permease protein
VKLSNPKNILSSYFYVIPALILVGIFTLAPLFYTIYLAFVYWRVGAGSELNGTFVGLLNFQRLIEDEAFKMSLINTLILGLGGSFGSVFLGLITALILNKPFKGRGIFRSIVLLPWAIPAVISGRFWKILFLPNGAVSTLLYSLGLVESPQYSILGDHRVAMIGVIIAIIWSHAPFSSLVILGGLQGVPLELYDSAKVDGASSLQIFRHITFPFISRFINISLLFTSLAVGGAVSMVYALTGGGPGYSTEVVALYLYKIYFYQWDFGKGGALSTILTLWFLFSSFPLILMLFRQIMREE